MKEELVSKIKTLKRDYFFQIEPIDIFNENVFSCVNIAHSLQGYWVSDMIGRKIHSFDQNFKYKYSLELNASPVGINELHDKIYICDPRKKALLCYIPKKSELCNISVSEEIQKPQYITEDSSGNLYISDLGCIWKYKNGFLEKLVEIDNIYVRGLKVIDEKVYVYDGNDHILYILNLNGEHLKQILFKENFIRGNRFIGFEIDPTSLIFYISQGQSIYKYNQYGELLFIVDLKNYFSKAADIKRLFLSYFKNNMCLYLISTNKKLIYRVFLYKP